MGVLRNFEESCGRDFLRVSWFFVNVILMGIWLMVKILILMVVRNLLIFFSMILMICCCVVNNFS